jgi:hypothetical protein
LFDALHWFKRKWKPEKPITPMTFMGKTMFSGEDVPFKPSSDPNASLQAILDGLRLRADAAAEGLASEVRLREAGCGGCGGCHGGYCLCSIALKMVI